jgi:hypothetical protein
LKTQEKAGGKSITRFDPLWINLLFLSFAFDRPILTLTGFLRVDPRPFDLVWAGFLLYVLKNRHRLKARISAPWYFKRPLFLLLLWFAVVVTFQFAFMPGFYQNYSIYFLLRYFQLFIAVWLVATSKLSDQQRITTIRLFLISVVAVTLIGLLQYLGVVPFIRRIGPGQLVDFTGLGALGFEVRITSTLGEHYAHFGNYSLLGVVLATLLIMNRGKRSGANGLAYIALLSGIVGIALSQALSAFYGLLLFGFLLLLFTTITQAGSRPRLYVLMILVAILVVLLLMNAPPNVLGRFERSVGLIQTGIEVPDNPVSRFARAFDFIRNFQLNASFQDFVLGRGFYVARDFMELRRVGYGLHNIVVFPLEQAGVPGFLLGLYVFWVFISRPWKQMRNPKYTKLMRSASLVVFCWAVMLLGTGQSGQIFWIFEAYGFWFVLVLCMWSLLISPAARTAEAEPG